MAQATRPARVGSWSEAAQRVLRERYLMRRGKEVLETPEGMCWRVATAVARAEALHGRGPAAVQETAEAFYDLMVDGTFLPNSPTLMNAGKDNGLQYSACYVLPVGDSMEEIFEAVKRAAIIHKSGGGTGFAFSRLRPKDSLVESTGGKASGPVSFLRAFNGATDAVKQGGTRRGANMGILRVDHPDILEFIDCKLDGGITNFNISVAITDRFMQALEADGEYDLVDPHTREVTRRLRAREVFDRIVRAAWRTGDPGLFFIDRCNAGRANPVPGENIVEATNPCGEQPLYPNEACNLGSLNVAQFVRSDRKGIDWEGLDRVVRTSVRYLDNVIDVNPYPLPEIDRAVKENRRIGLGLMGWADLLQELGISYDSHEALVLAEQLMAFIQRVGHEASADLARERGPFPNWPKSIDREGPPLRNSTVTTIAPTGTISIIAGCSSGIEPIFAVSYVRNVLDGTELVEVNPIFEEVAKQRGFYSEQLMKEIARKGTVRGLDSVPDEVQAVFATAHDIDPVWHVRMQAAFQENVDNAVSKTVNFPHGASPNDVEEVYVLAYKSGCKGVTVYRDGSRASQVLNIGAVNREAHNVRGTPRPRPAVTRGTTEKIRTGCSNLYITINEDEQGLCEVFTQMGKSGGCTASQSEAISRLISLALRSGIEPDAVVKQIKGIRCPSPAWSNGGVTLSCADAIAKALERFLQERRGVQWQPHMSKESAGLSGHCPECPECGHLLEFGEGCVVCRACGFSKC